MDLFTAIRAGDLGQVQSVLAQDPGSLNRRNERGHTPVLIAQYHHKTDIAAYLLSLAPELDVFDACSAGQTARVAELLDRDPGLLNAYGGDGFFPLGLAAFFGHAETTALLLDRGADVAVVSRNPLRQQALHFAVASGQAQVAKLLIDRGADPKHQDAKGKSPIGLAADRGDAVMLKALKGGA